MTRRQSGFTLIELLMAMAVFSFMLMIISIGFLNIVHMQQNGVQSRATQQAARLALEDISRTARAASVAVTLPAGDPNPNELCLFQGNQPKVSYYLDSNSHQLFKTTNGCYEADDPIPGTQLVGSNVVALRFTPTIIDDGTGTHPDMVSLELTVGSVASLDGPDPAHPCPTTDQFCAATTLSTAVSMRGMK